MKLSLELSKPVSIGGCGLSQAFSNISATIRHLKVISPLLGELMMYVQRIWKHILKDHKSHLILLICELPAIYGKNGKNAFTILL